MLSHSGNRIPLCGPSRLHRHPRRLPAAHTPAPVVPSADSCDGSHSRAAPGRRPRRDLRRLRATRRQRRPRAERLRRPQRGRAPATDRRPDLPAGGHGLAIRGHGSRHQRQRHARRGRGRDGRPRRARPEERDSRVHPARQLGRHPGPRQGQGQRRLCGRWPEPADPDGGGAYRRCGSTTSR